MAKYKVTANEILYLEPVEVEAENEDDAKEKFERRNDDGKVTTNETELHFIEVKKED